MKREICENSNFTQFGESKQLLCLNAKPKTPYTGILLLGISIYNRVEKCIRYTALSVIHNKNHIFKTILERGIISSYLFLAA